MTAQTKPTDTAHIDAVRRLHGSITGACQGLTNLFETGRLPPFEQVLQDVMNKTKRNETEAK